MSKSSEKKSGRSASLVETCRTHIRNVLESERDTRRAYNHLTSYAVKISDISACSLFLPSTDRNANDRLELRSHSGKERIPSPTTLPVPSANHPASGVYTLENNFTYIDVRCINTVIGKLAIKASSQLSAETIDCLKELAWAAGVLFERQRLVSEILVYRERIEVLTELNQLVVSGTNLSRVSKTLAREAAFRFGADSSLLFFLNESSQELQVKGAYGFPMDVLPDSIPVLNTLMGRALRLGGMFSIPDLASQEDHGLSFIVDSGTNCIHSCTLDVSGKTIGVIVVGFQKRTPFGIQSALMLQEYAQGAAVALKNSLTQVSLSNYNENLEELVQSRTSELAIQMSESDEANKAKSRFIANMSHELRTPLTAIVGYTSVLKDGVYGAMNPQQVDALVSIAKSSEHLQELIDEVLNLSKIEAGKDTPEPSGVEIVSLLKQIYKLMLQSALTKGLEYSGLPENVTELDGVKLWVDPRHIRQILINLISNAIKYTPEGGSVDVKAEIVGDKLKIGVFDTGVGVSEEQKNRLFSRFERGEDSYSLEQKGTGIGLSLTKHIVELNGGKIGVESTEGEGSEFWILMPLAASDSVSEIPDELAENESKADSLLDGLNILIVDDNEATCQVLDAIVSKSGGVGYLSNSVAEAKDIIAEQSIDAALIDLAMPGESGLDLIEHFRKFTQAPLNSIPLIVVSACVFDTDREKAMDAGASEFIAKPFRPNDVLQAIREQTTSSVINTGTFPVMDTDEASKE